MARNEDAEEWRPVLGWEGLYEVSSHGQVRSLDREVHTVGPHGPFTKNVRGRVLKQTPSGKGYLRVPLSRDKKTFMTLVHRIVLESFCGPCPEGYEACHYDDDQNNNNISNLRWGTRSENTYDKVRNGNHQNARKTRCPQGHEYTPENTYSPPGNPRFRNCRKCAHQRKRAIK